VISTIIIIDPLELVPLLIYCYYINLKRGYIHSVLKENECRHLFLYLLFSKFDKKFSLYSLLLSNHYFSLIFIVVCISNFLFLFHRYNCLRFPLIERPAHLSEVATTTTTAPSHNDTQAQQHVPKAESIEVKQIEEEHATVASTETTAAAAAAAVSEVTEQPINTNTAAAVVEGNRNRSTIVCFL
jgi:hypothetical protein